MPRGKKTPDPAGAEDARNGTDAAPKKPRTRAGTARRPAAEAVVVGVEAAGVPVAAAGALQTAAIQDQLTDLQRQLAEITRQASEARSAVRELREERERIGRELGELRQQVRAAQEQSLKETRDGYAKVGRELDASAGRLADTVRRAREELDDVIRRAQAARRELGGPRRADPPPPEPDVPANAEPEPPPARAKDRPAADARNRLGVTVGNGVVVAEVIPGSPAEVAGLTRGDVIEEVNDTGIDSAAQLRDAVLQARNGNEVTLRVFRAGETHEVRVTLAVVPDANAEAEGRNHLGVTVGPGVVVAEVLPDTPAAAAGLAPGDVIDDLNGQPVRSGEELRDLVHRLPAGDALALRVTRAGEVCEVRVRANGG